MVEYVDKAPLTYISYETTPTLSVTDGILRLNREPISEA